jgi:hypothetical protein
MANNQVVKPPFPRLGAVHIAIMPWQLAMHHGQQLQCEVMNTSKSTSSRSRRMVKILKTESQKSG